MTAHKFLLDFEKKYPRLQCEVSTEEDKKFFYSTAQGAQVTIDVMIEFAKMHVRTFAEKIADGFIDDISSWSGNPYTGEGSISLDRDKILAIYPESLIT